MNGPTPPSIARAPAFGSVTKREIKYHACCLIVCVQSKIYVLPDSVLEALLDPGVIPNSFLSCLISEADEWFNILCMLSRICIHDHCNFLKIKTRYIDIYIKK